MTALPETRSGLVVSGLTHYYGDVAAIRDVSFSVGGGQIAVLLGPSGCGKSTVLRALAGLIRPQTGSIRLGGYDLDQVPTRARRVGMVFQNYALFPHMTVAENIGYALSCHGVPRAERRRRVDELLALVRLEGLSKRMPRELSGGQQQRVAVARALAVDPTLLLLDEPFGALDRSLRQELQMELLRLHRSVGVTTILVTHDQEEAQALASVVVLMNFGRVEQVGTPSELYDSPGSLFAASFIGHSSLLRGTVAENSASGSRVRLSTGEHLLTEPTVYQPGTDVVVAVRPEHVQPNAPRSSTTLTARLKMVLPAGSNVHYEFSLSDGTALRVAVPRHGGTVGLAVGEDATLGVEPKRCRVFRIDPTEPRSS